MKKIIFAIIAVLATLASCDSMEETYKEFAGDGPIRYAGKCKDIKVAPGWECLRASWKLSDDPTIKNIIVKCVNGADTIVQALPATATETVVENLENKDYQVTVQSLAEDGALSICTPIIERPYTLAHESVQGFSYGISKSFLFKDHLLLFMGKWDNSIDNFNISYTDMQGNAKTFDLTQAVFQEKYVDVAGVDTSKPIQLNRTGWIEGCPDLITFEPVSLTRSVAMYSDFRTNIQQRYGVKTNDLDSFSSTAQDIELDNSMFSFEDLLYFTHLKHISLGKNHYFDGTHFLAPTVDESALATWVLEKLNEINGTEVDVYQDAYIPASTTANYIKRHGFSQLPSLNYLPTKGWTVSNGQEDENSGFLKDLLDNDPNTTWTAWPSNSGIRTMQLTINMDKAHEVNGVKIVQSGANDAKDFLQGTVKVEYYADGAWHNLTHIEDNTIGKAQGEATVLRAAKAVTTSQIRVTVKDVNYKGQVKVSLADIAVF